MILKVIRCFLAFTVLSSQIVYAQNVYFRPLASTDVNQTDISGQTSSPRDSGQDDETQLRSVPQQESYPQAGARQSQGGSQENLSPSTGLRPPQSAVSPGTAGTRLPSVRGRDATTPSTVEDQVPFREIPAPRARMPQEELSDFEKYVAGKSPRELSFDIKQFGYDLFVRPTLATSSVQRNVPVGPDYVIGPGDELRINVWGSIEGIWNITVDRDGNITIPKIGTIGVTGLTFQEMKDTLRKEISKQFNDFEINVSMGQLRTLRVYVVGKANKPGAFTVSSLSTLINALYESGGPSKVGTMRDIQLKRNGETITHLDLYDFLLTGSKLNDARLMPEDVIFIPTIGPMVGIAGNVKAPAIYELKGPTRVTDLIKLAGGVTAKAFLQRVQVERISNKSNKMLVDLNLDRLKGKDDILLENGDIVKIFPVSPNVANKIVLKGNVWRPGEYQWHSGMRVRDLIRSTEDLLPETLMDRAQIDRLVPPDYHMEYRTFNLGRLLLEDDEHENLYLKPYDRVVVFNKWDIKEKDKVRTEGALNKPGEYDFRANMKLSDLIGLSGGLKYYAMTETAELTRVTPTPDGPRTEKITVCPARALEGDPIEDIELRENDYLFVRAVPDWELYKTVQIEGEVKFPGTYTFEKGEKLSSVLVRAGGYTPSAYLRGAVFTRKSVKKVQQEQLKQMAERLQRDLMVVGISNVGAALSADEAKVLEEQNKAKLAFLEGLKQVEAKGRLVINLDSVDKLRRSADDIELESGDNLTIPVNPQSVQIVGAVYNQNAIFYEQGKDYAYYIQMSGGFSEGADKKNVFVIKANGRAFKPQAVTRWDRSSRQWSIGYGQIEPGDTIVVPDKLDKVPWMRTVKDVTQILFQIATTAGIAFLAR
jgi:protein involved in polysaccharide export with SLBB domain